MITETRREEVEHLIQAYGPRAAMDFVRFYTMMEREGVSIEEIQALTEFFAKEKTNLETSLSLQAKEAEADWKAAAPICPDCKGSLSLKHICKKKGPENIHGYTCLWFCENGDCIYEEYTYENAAEEINKLMERKKNG